jgi:hypothetical protein
MLFRNTRVGFLSRNTMVLSSTTRVSARAVTLARVGKFSLGSIQRSK